MNLTIFLGKIFASILVFGFLRILSFLFNTLNVPKEAILNLLSFIMSDIIISKKLSIIFKDKLDPRNYNGAIFLGLQSPVVKSHGSTDAIGFANSISVCNRIVKADLIKKIESNLITVDAEKNQ